MRLQSTTFVLFRTSPKCINLFTVALYSKSQVCQPFLIIADSQDKGRNSVFTFINALTNYIQFEKGDMVIICTDELSSEFKNRYLVKLVCMLSKKFQSKVSWKYFATSHGKGVVDGIGGSAKSLMRKRVMNQGKNAVIVQNSADFYKVAKDDMKGVSVLHISEGQISEMIKEKKPWENIKDASGISKMHVISCCDGLTVEMFKTNLNKGPSSTIVYEDEDVDRSEKLNVGDWALVSYHGTKFPDEVVSIIDTDIEVSVMKYYRKGKWYWPDKADIITYWPENVIGKLSPSVPVGMVDIGRNQDVLYHFQPEIFQ